MTAEAPSLQRCGDREAYPLSLNQREIWFQRQLHGEAALNNLSRQVVLRGPLDHECFARALQAVADRQESLRAVFAAHEDGPRQRIVPEVRLECPVSDLRGRPAVERAQLVAARHRELVALPFDLGEAPLIRTELVQAGEQEHLLLCVFHNLVLDGLNFSKFLDDVGAAYAALRSGGSARLPPLPLRYADFAVWQDERLSRGALAEHEEYWRRQLEPPVPEMRLANDRDPGAARTFELATLDRSVRPDVFRRLDALAKPYHTTLFRVVLGAFEVFLQRATGERDILLGVPFSLRPPKLRDVLGFFGHAVPVRASVGGGGRFCDLLAEVNEQLARARAHMEYPLGAAVRNTRLGVDLSRPILPIYVAQERNVELTAGELSITTGPALVFEVYDLMLAVFPTAQGLSLTYCYSAELFEPQTIAHLADSFEGLLAQVAADPEARISKLRLQPPGDAGRVVDAATGREDGPWPEELIAQRAREDPERVAFVSGPETWSYGDLDQRADRLASRLRSAGASPEQRVGILGRRSPAMWAAVLAVMKAGAAFVPLDPEDPEARLRALVSAGGLRWLAVDAEHEELAAAVTCGTGCRVVGWDEGAGGQGGDLEPAAIGAAGHELACVFYTSGSTGTPKGVMVERSGMRNHLRAKVERLGLGLGDVVLQNASHCFDVSVWQALAPLTCGGRVVICDEERARDPEAMLALVKAEGVTVLETVPSFLELMLGLAEAPEALRRLRYLVSNAETLPVSLCRRWFERCGAALVNTWGATECSDDVTHEVMAEAIAGDRARVGVGQAIAGARVYALDEELQPVPAGCAGEIAVAGVCVGRGYLADPAGTAQAFVPDPFAEHGGRLYVTGDVGRLRSDGVLEFLGRRDGQVKVRGHRVEVGEVEGALAAHPAVSQAAVDERAGRLVAWWAGASDVEAGELRRHLSATLPAYMLPEVFVRLDALPQTRSGKLDRRALPSADWTQGRPEYVAPRTELERQIAQVWQDVLAVDRVGVHDNFFDLGGHSLNATRIVLNLRRGPGIEVSIRQLFQTPTVAGLAVLAEGRGASASAAEGIPSLPERAAYPLSVAQTAQWLGFHRVLEGEITGWGFPEILRIEGALDVGRLREALRALVARHEALRTSFAETAGGPGQVIHGDVEIECPLHDLSSSQGAEQHRKLQSVLMEEVLAPLDGKPPLLRVRLIRLGPERHLLTMQLPHIVMDGWTDEILAEDLAELYTALEEGRPAALEPGRVRYVDFASWQNARLESAPLRAEKDYWLERFADGVPVLRVPRQAKQASPDVDLEPRRSLHVRKDVVARMRKLAASRNTTLFVALLASFEALLARLTGDSDLVVGTPVAGRIHPALDRVAGLFMNPLALRSDLSGDPTFLELLDRVGDTMLGALAHQEYPFPEWLQELRHRHGRNDLYPYSLLLFVQEGIRGLRFGAAPAVLESCQTYGIGAAPQVVHGILGPTLSLFVAEGADEWRADVFDALSLDRSLVADLLPRWSRLLQQVLDHPARRLSELDVLLGGERAALAGFVHGTELDAELSRVVQAYRQGGIAALCGDGSVAAGSGPQWLDPLSLLTLLARREATVLVADGTTLSRLASAAAETAAFESLRLRHVVVAGVVSAGAVRRQWQDRRVSAFTVLHEETGTILWIDEVEGGEQPIAGRPIGRAAVHVLDSWRRPSPIGIEGEIHVGGALEDTERLAAVSLRGRWRRDGALELVSPPAAADVSRAERRPRFGEPAYLAPRTPLERQIAAVWRAVLAVEAGAFDDLIELGGGAEEAVEISARLGARNLLALPGHVLRHRTVASLAAFVEENGQLRSAGRDAEPAIPTLLQRSLLAAAIAAPAAAVTSVDLQARTPLDPDAVSEALRITAREHDALRLRFRKDGGLWLSVVEAEGDTATRALDLTGVRPDRRSREWRTAVEAERSRLSATRPGLRAVVAGNRLALLASALVVDEPSWPVLIEAFERAYAGLVTNGPVEADREHRSFHAWLAAADRLAAYRDPAVLGAAPISVVERAARWRIAGPLGRVLASLSVQTGEAALTAAIGAVLPDASIEVEGDRRGRGAGIPDLTKTIGQFGRMGVVPADAGAGAILRARFVASPPLDPARRFRLLRFDPARILVGAQDLRVTVLAKDGIHLALQWDGRHALVGRAAAALRRDLQRELAGTLGSAKVEAARFDTVELNPDELEKLLT